MAFIVKSRVKERVAVTGTGAFPLGGAVADFRTFASQMSNGDTTWYYADDPTASAWEEGVGTWNTGNTLSRTLLLDSSTGSAISFAGNDVDIFMGLPASAVPAGALNLIGMGITSNGQVGTRSLPANGTLVHAIIRETAGHAVSVSLGTTNGGTDITNTPIPIPSSGVTILSLLSFAKIWFSASAAQAIYVSSTSWGSASVNVSLLSQVAP